MADTSNKKEREKKKSIKRKEKLFRKESRKDNANIGGWESMIAYVDSNGMLSDTPPDPNEKKGVKAENIEIGVAKREAIEADKTLSGFINYFDLDKGYGFIKSPDDESFFVHINDISGEPARGKKVSFEKAKGQRGWTAIKVKIKI